MSHTRSSRSHLEAQYATQNRSGLRVGDDVDVKYPDGHVDKAKIDAKSPDSRMVWLLSYAGQGRKMYGDWEGVCLSSAPRDHDGDE
ncbi:hypothetical protein DXK94_00145 [Arthrobacter sp. RT-1]|nr:hypothetical protein DXK94_00145 [Arthrobacter sp. RT-1]